MAGSVQELRSGLGVQRSRRNEPGREPRGQGLWGIPPAVVRRENVLPSSPDSLLSFSDFTSCRLSWCWCYGHFEQDDSLLWGLSCALQVVKQHPDPLPARGQCTSLLQLQEPEMSPSVARYPLGAKSRLVENPWSDETESCSHCRNLRSRVTLGTSKRRRQMGQPEQEDDPCSSKGKE